MSDSKNDIAWRLFFDKHNIIQNIITNGYVIINSEDINEFRQARLMTKFDHRKQLPKIFYDNKLAILPVSRGGYIIGDFDIFYELDDDREIEIKKIEFPGHLESIDYNNITSESAAINCAFVSGILFDFIGEIELTPTVSGRMSSSCFQFSINSKGALVNINVENSQLEIDGGYEGPSSLNIIEAKNYISDDFLIRQLYYPFRLWKEKITKEVRTIFLTYTNGIFHLKEYLFETPNHYNSLRLIQQKKYAIKEDAINNEIIQKILESSKVLNEPNIAFPQANSFERVINLCELIKEKLEISRDDITKNYDFDERQTNYYSDAARYLGLVDKKMVDKQVIFFLTERGREVFNYPIGNRQIEFVKLILSHLVFKNSLELYFEKGQVPDKEEIVEVMKTSNLHNIESDSTFYRRASTILSWLNWILGLVEE